MLGYEKALWRVEYRTDLTRAKALVIPLAYMLDAGWENDVRWLGMLFRKRLSVAERDLVNLETWPEMNDLEKYMGGLFDEAWSGAEDGNGRLGSRALAPKYSMHSALYFSPQDSSVDLAADDPIETFPQLYGYLLGFRDTLSPVATAPVVPFKKKPVVVGARGEVELEHKAA